MKQLTSVLLAGVAVCGLALTPSSAEAGSKKLTLGRTQSSSAAGPTSSMRSMPSKSSQRLGPLSANHSPGLASKKLAHSNVGNLSLGSSSGKKFNQGGGGLQILQRAKLGVGTLGNQLANGNLNAAALKNGGLRSTSPGGLKNAGKLGSFDAKWFDRPITGGLTLNRRIAPRSPGKNPVSIADAGRLAGSVFNPVTGQNGNVLNPDVRKLAGGIGSQSGPIIDSPIFNHDDVVDGVFRPFDPDLLPPGYQLPEPGNEPPGNEPPGNEPPGNEPPGNEPPGNEPPANEPPGNEPPANEPPCNEPPAEEPCDPPYCPPHDYCDYFPFPWWPVSGGFDFGTVSCPPVTNVTIVEQPAAVAVNAEVAPPVQAGPMTVDLELLDLRLVDPGDAARKLGVRYRVTFRNRGAAPAGNFQLLVMASRDGKPAPDAPTATAESAGLAGGEVASVDVRLPFGAELATMPALIVALDSAVQVAESDEQNNVAVLDRSKIAAAEPTTLGTGVALGN